MPERDRKLPQTTPEAVTRRIKRDIYMKKGYDLGVTNAASI